MKEFDYIPQVKDEDGNLLFEGTVRVSVPDEHERLEIIKSLNVKVNKEGEVDIKDQEELTRNAGNILNLAREHIVKVDLESGGMKLKDINDLGYFEEGSQVLNEVAHICTNGIKLGNALKPRSKTK